MEKEVLFFDTTVKDPIFFSVSTLLDLTMDMIASLAQ